MANLIVKDPPTFTSEIHKTEKEELITADLENEIKSALLNNDVFLKALAEAIQEKAKEHIEDGNIHVTSQDKQNWSGKAGTAVATQTADGLESAADKRKLDGMAAGAEVNQNAFSNVKAGNVTVSANGKTATFILEAGANITISADNASKKIMITANRDGGNAATLEGHAASYFAVLNHNHNGSYYTKTEVNNALSVKAAADHGHDGRYHTKEEITNLLNQKANSNHNHNGGKYLAGQGTNGGYSFTNDGAEDTGMFSDKDGDLYFMQNGVKRIPSYDGHDHNGSYYTKSEIDNAMNGKLSTGASCNKNWNWAGQEGQPTWVWGGNEINNMYVYNPRNFHVNYADSAGSAGSASKLTANAGSSMQPVYFSGGVPVATSVRGVAIQSSTPSNTSVLWAW